METYRVLESRPQARVVLSEVAEAVKGWRTAARHNGITPAEITRFEPTLDYTIDALRPS